MHKQRTVILFPSDVKNDDGCFVVTNEDITCNSDYVASATDEFMQYSEKSKEQFMPGIKDNGEQKKVGRTCQTYSLGVGTANTAVTYSFSVDKETGITEFITEDVPLLTQLLEK